MKRLFILFLLPAAAVALLLGALFLGSSGPVSAGSSAILIDAVYYDGQLTREPDEAVRLVNRSQQPVDLAGWQLNDSLTDSSHLAFPAGTVLGPGERLWVTKDAAAFVVSFGFSPTLAAAQMNGSWIGLANSGDEVVLRDGAGLVIDVLIYGSSSAGTTTTAWNGTTVKPYKIHHGTAVEGQILYRKTDRLTGLPTADTNSAADWAQDAADPFQGRKVLYPGWDLASFGTPSAISTTAVVTAAIAPDHAYEFLVTLIDQADREIVGEYHTFDNPAVAERLTAAAARGVTVTLLLEGGPPGGVSDQARLNCQALATAGGGCWVMISDHGLDISDRFAYIHSKFLIIDRSIVVVSTENLSPNSLPSDPKADGTWGRRGVLLALQSADIVDVFEKIWHSDFAPHTFLDIQPIDHLGGPGPGFVPEPPTNPTTYTVRTAEPAIFVGSFDVEVVQSPENSLDTEAGVLGLIARAGSGDQILSQQLTERPVWQENDPNGENLRLAALIEAARRGASVWVMLDSYFDDPTHPLSNSATCEQLRQISRFENLDLHCQLQNPAGLGIHNKTTIFFIDGEGYSLVGSINGTEQSFKANREVAVIVESWDLASFLSDVFWQDWRFSAYLPIIYHDFLGPAEHVLISEIYPNPFGATDAAEFIELVNPTPFAIDLAGYSLSDALRQDEFADLKRFPIGTWLPPGQTIVVAQQGTAFFDQFGFHPNFEILNATEQVPDLIDDPLWGDPNQFLRLGNVEDVVVLRNPAGEIVDGIGYGGRQVDRRPDCVAPPSGQSLRRNPYWRTTASCPNDFQIWPVPDPGKLP